MSIYVILGTPGAFDFAAFGESTRKTLALLAPLLDLERSQERVAQEILAQVREFSRAIKLGLEAAQCGFTATEDILTLTRLMDSTTLEDRNEYLQGTVELADRAYSKAQEAFQVFRDIRTRIFATTEQYNVVTRTDIPSTSYPSPSREYARRRSIEDFQRNIHVLEEFSEKISAFIQWWDWIRVETRAGHVGRSIAFDDSSLRERSVIERWTLLRNQFADYTNMIGQLEDSYPELLMPRHKYRAPTRGIDVHRSDLRLAVGHINRRTSSIHSPRYSDYGELKPFGCCCVVV